MKLSCGDLNSEIEIKCIEAVTEKTLAHLYIFDIASNYIIVNVIDNQKAVQFIFIVRHECMAEWKIFAFKSMYASFAVAILVLQRDRLQRKAKMCQPIVLLFISSQNSKLAYMNFELHPNCVSFHKFICVECTHQTNKKGPMWNVGHIAHSIKQITEICKLASGHKKSMPIYLPRVIVVGCWCTNM